MLAVPLKTQSTGVPLVLLHGFTQNGGFWTPHAEDLKSVASVLAPDLPGHGATAAQHDEADLWATASLVSGVGGRATYAGYSLGARAALHVALLRPDLVDGLILFGAKAGLEDVVERSHRQASDDALASRIEGGGVKTFIDEWLDQPFNARLPPEGQRRNERYGNRSDGLAASLRNCGSGVQEPLWERLKEIDVPVLVVHGSDDLPHVIDDSHRIAAEIGANARLAVLENCGHAAPFEKPRAASALIRYFLLANQE